MQAPKITDETQPVEDGLVLFPGMRPPVIIQPIRIPRQTELNDLADRNRRAWLPPAQPSLDVLFRPEEIHCRSCKDDVIPPLSGWDHAVEDEA